jgi:type IV pilus assembly protein PilE
MNRYQSAGCCRHSAGFTLIEMMIAVAIGAILISVALPSYQSYVRRGHLSDAFTTLADMRVKMEQYYQDNKFYGTGVATTTCATLPGYSAFPVATKYFSIDCSNAGGAAPLQVFRLTATGTGGLTTGYDYTVNQAGAKGTAKFAGTASTAACWLTKSNSCDN